MTGRRRSFLDVTSVRSRIVNGLSERVEVQAIKGEVLTICRYVEFAHEFAISDREPQRPIGVDKRQRTKSMEDRLAEQKSGEELRSEDGEIGKAPSVDMARRRENGKRYPEWT